ncbi:MAG: 4Fe-4S dicluster domain-containing protein [Bacteroidetes bacterium]|nr:4Fe-4S dicluster domain-containing protein [Bacteroidota bacterium]
MLQDQKYRSTLSGTLYSKLGIHVERCYQCGKCSAGCPAASAMDLKPSIILRMLQVENERYDREVLQSYTIWLCLSCHTCSTRCPMEIDIPRVMDVLRSESLRQNLIHPRAKDIVAFHVSFLNTIKRFGRLWEVGMIVEYKIRTRHFFQDVLLAPVLFLKGKLTVVPHKCVSIKQLFTWKKQESSL